MQVVSAWRLKESHHPKPLGWNSSYVLLTVSVSMPVTWWAQCPLSKCMCTHIWGSLASLI